MSFRLHAFQFKGPKKRQEDAYAFLPFVPSAPEAACVVGVFDGISCTVDPHLAAQHASVAFQNALLTRITCGDLAGVVEDALFEAHMAVLRLRRRQAYRDLADTDKPATVGAAALITFENKVILGHLGDTGVLLRRGKQLYPLTTQHTNGEGAVERYLGQPNFQAEITHGEIVPEDEVVIGSDGALSALLASENPIPLLFFYKASDSIFSDNATALILTQTIETKPLSHEEPTQPGVPLKR